MTLTKSELPAKGFSTVSTLVMLFLSVSSLMLSKSVFVIEGFPASTAFIMLWCDANSVVFSKVRIMIKASPTGEWPLCPLALALFTLVNNKARALVEELPTLGALVRPFSSGSVLMLDEVRSSEGHLPTLTVLTCPFSGGMLWCWRSLILWLKVSPCSLHL